LAVIAMLNCAEYFESEIMLNFSVSIKFY